MKTHRLMLSVFVAAGFATTAERDFFRLMIENVTGVGPKVALSIMSRLSLPLLENAIRIGDVATLAKCPGIGKKTAERLVVELKSKVSSAHTAVLATGGETADAAANSDDTNANASTFIVSSS